MTGMRILFAGSAADYRNATGGEGCLPAPFLFFCTVDAGDQLNSDVDIQLVPYRQYFVRMADTPVPPATCPILVSGPSNAMAEALACGCADYLVEPWSDDELLARAGRCACFALAGQEISFHGLQVRGPGGEKILGPDEAYLLRLLLANRRSGISRQHLASLLRLPEGGRAIDMRISRLRRYLQAISRNLSPGWLRSRRGVYCLTSSID